MLVLEAKPKMEVAKPCLGVYMYQKGVSIRYTSINSLKTFLNPNHLQLFFISHIIKHHGFEDQNPFSYHFRHSWHGI